MQPTVNGWGGHDRYGPNLAFHGLLLLLGGVGFAVRSPRAHPPLAYFSLSIFVAYVAILFADL